jgi:hypothetical protein
VLRKMVTDNQDNPENNDDNIDWPEEISEETSIDEADFDTEFKEDLSFDDEDSFLESDEEALTDPYMDDFEDEHRSQSSMNLFNIGIIAFFVVAIAGVAYITLPNIFSGDDATQQTASNSPSQSSPQELQQTARILQDAPQITESAPQDAGGILANPEMIMTEDDMENLQARVVAEDQTRVFEALNQPVESNEGVFDAIRGLDSVVDDNAESLPMAREDMIISTDEQQVATEMDTLPVPSDLNASLDDEIEMVNENQGNSQRREPSRPQPVFEASPEQNNQMQQGQNNNDMPMDVFEFAAETMVQDNVENNMAPIQSAGVSSQSQQESAGNSDDIAELNSRIDSLMATMNQIVERIDRMAQNTQQPNITDQADNETIASLQTTIEGMEKRIASLTSEIEETRESVTRPAQRQASPPQQSVARSAPQPRPTIQYDLRGATAELAYISRQGTDNLQTVRVGDTVAGLGRITSISQESGRWVVRGTNNSVRQ